MRNIAPGFIPSDQQVADFTRGSVADSSGKPLVRASAPPLAAARIAEEIRRHLWRLPPDCLYHVPTADQATFAAVLELLTPDERLRIQR